MTNCIIRSLTVRSIKLLICLVTIAALAAVAPAVEQGDPSTMPQKSKRPQAAEVAEVAEVVEAAQAAAEKPNGAAKAEEQAENQESVDYSKAAIVNRDEPEALNDGTTRITFDVRSPSMKRDIKTAIVLPPAYEAEPQRRFPVLYALHGMGAPYKAFTDMSPLRRTMKERPFILVTFSGDAAGWYIDSTVRDDSQFATFFFDELIPSIDEGFRTRTEATARGVTGFSMGGYGAMQYMLSRPDVIGSASALSGAFSYMGELSGRPHGSLVSLLGNYQQNQDNYLKYGIFNRIEQFVKDRKPLPPIYLHCGTEDHLIGENRQLAAFLIKQNQLLRSEKAGYSITFQYQESPGAHNWPFWRDASAGVADFHYRVFQTPPAKKDN